MSFKASSFYFHQRLQQAGKAIAPIKLAGIEDVNGSGSGFWGPSKQAFIMQ
jgi:hypothetical protein